MADLVESMFSAYEASWHRKGIIVDHVLTAAEAVTAAGLDWEVRTSPVWVDGQETTWQATVRQDTGAVLGIVGPRYRPVQNGELFEFFDRVVDPEDGAFYHTGGSLMHGKRVWLLAKVPGDFYVPGVPDDLVANYILLASSHDGSLCVLAKHTPVRVVCNNTLSMALRGEKRRQVSIKHTTNAVQQLREASAVLGLAQKRAEAIQAKAEALINVKLSSPLIQDFFRLVFPSTAEVDGNPASAKARRHRETVYALLEDSQSNRLRGMAGTGWALYNATAEYADHLYPQRKGTDTLNRIWFGQAEALKAKAAAVLLGEVKG